MAPVTIIVDRKTIDQLAAEYILLNDLYTCRDIYEEMCQRVGVDHADKVIRRMREVGTMLGI